MELEHITLRKHKRCMSNKSINKSFVSSQSDLQAMSLPDLSTEFTENQLSEENKTLKLLLEEANTELKNMRLKIQELERQLIESKANISAHLKNDTNKHCTSSSNKHTNNSYPNEKKSIDNQRTNCYIMHNNGNQNRSSSITSNNQKILKQNKFVLNQESSKPISEEYSSKINQKTNTKKAQLFILGSQQLRGLSRKLIESRKTIYNYENYEISSFIKPFAKTEDILKSSFSLNLTERDQLVICVGENDNNPTKLLYELSSALKLLNTCNIIIVNTNYNSYLNENMLNDSVKFLCSQFSNCEFLTIQMPNKQNNFKYLTYLSNKINHIIDSRFYKQNFLCSIKMLQSNYSNYNKSCIPKKGTIPYYFNNKKENTCKQSTDHIKKGTIPYYFCKLGTNIPTIERLNKNSFFRSK